MVVNNKPLRIKKAGGISSGGGGIREVGHLDSHDGGFGLCGLVWAFWEICPEIVEKPEW